MKYEETIDFFMSWTIRCADVIYESISEKKVHDYSKKILNFLVSEEANIEQDDCFQYIKVWKQCRNVDIWVELEIGQDRKKYAILIENKMYSSIRPNQLEHYKKIAEEYYAGEDEYKLLFIFLRPDYELELQDKSQYNFQKLGYRYLNLEQLKDQLPKEKTDNELFDEFWYKWYEV
ncbi:PD-(D/E)XK nuclease family protein [Maribacter dokdonensis]|uniref:PD-(D/E)XK nuclease family protein n=1 Tax=Maribacter dokdonensis TaxID=320912 RepID=UPI0027358078|nr:PD-(D/E)XK nuclease family protein [Maribacter dokdonensis]MDP2525642.1 PD-(D/E)XK nuclease family protein [Maribacter dokdonensis]